MISLRGLKLKIFGAVLGTIKNIGK